MINNKYLIRINNFEDLEEYKKKGFSNFLFALKDFSVGYNSFDLEDIKDVSNKYLLVNRVFDNDTCDKFKKIIPFLKDIKGIIFEDIAVYMFLKNTDIPLIWNQAHYVINSRSINSWLTRVSSACISNELTLDEINYILDKSNKKLVLPILGRNMSMYSRRYLLSYFNSHKGLKMIKKGTLTTDNGKEFIAMENEYGTVLFYKKFFNYLNYKFNDDKVLFYYVDPSDMNASLVIDVLNGKDIEMDNSFLLNKTIYKLEEKK